MLRDDKSGSFASNYAERTAALRFRLRKEQRDLSMHPDRIGCPRSPLLAVDK